MTFANIEYFFLLLLLIPYILWYVLKKQEERTYVVGVGYDGIPLCA